jgi:hypothetical protein
MAGKTTSCELTPEFKARMALADQKIRRQVVADFNHYAVKLASDLRAKAPKDTGALRVGIHPEMATEENLTVKIISNANYTTYVNEGTRPHFPPVASLLGWATRHKWPGVKDDRAARMKMKEQARVYKAEHPGKRKHHAAEQSKMSHGKKGAAERSGGEMTVVGEAFLIARAISRRGGKKQEFIDPVMKPAKAEIIKICQASLGKVNL